MEKWKKKLNKKELEHLKETGATTLKKVRANVMFQAKNEFPCWDCVSIGHKLGIVVDLKAFHEARKKGEA